MSTWTDNIVGSGFIKSVVDAFGVSAAATASDRSDSAAWRGHERATTGRVAGTAELFLRLGGYDEEDTMGSGGQDGDLLDRYQKAGRRQVLARYNRKGLAENHEVVGYPLPNDPNNRKADRTLSKTINCSNPMNLSWGQMNDHNCKIMWDRTRQGQYVRNQGIPRPGWPYQFIALCFIDKHITQNAITIPQCHLNIVC